MVLLNFFSLSCPPQSPFLLNLWLSVAIAEITITRHSNTVQTKHENLVSGVELYPTKRCWSPTPSNLWIWPYREVASFQMSTWTWGHWDESQSSTTAVLLKRGNLDTGTDTQRQRDVHIGVMLPPAKELQKQGEQFAADPTLVSSEGRWTWSSRLQNGETIFVV